jgi:hypothetical protein
MLRPSRRHMMPPHPVAMARGWIMTQRSRYGRIKYKMMAFQASAQRNPFPPVWVKLAVTWQTGATMSSPMETQLEL